MGKDLKGKELGTGYSQRKNGLYQARKMIDGVPLVMYNRDLRTLKRQFSEAVRQKTIEIANIKTRPGSCLLLKEWYEEWYEKYKVPMLKHGRDGDNKRIFERMFGDTLGERYLFDIKQMDIQEVIIDLVKNRGKTHDYVRKGVSVLRQCLQAAYANGMIPLDPTIGVKIPKTELAQRRILTVEEQHIFLEQLSKSKDWYEEMFQFMLLTGLRIGEIGALRWTDIDFERKLIYVRRNLVYIKLFETGKVGYKVMSLKTAKSCRTIPFFIETEAVLQRQWERIRSRKEDIGDLWRLDEEKYGDLVFTTSLGSPVGRRPAEGALKRISKDIRLLYQKDETEFEDIYPHALRHTFATRCLEAGMQPEILQDIMGHVKYEVTLSYVHILDDDKRKEAEKYKNLLNCQKYLQKKDILNIIDNSKRKD